MCNCRTPYWYRHSYHQPNSLQFFAPQDFDYGQKRQSTGHLNNNNNNNKGWFFFWLKLPLLEL